MTIRGPLVPLFGDGPKKGKERTEMTMQGRTGAVGPGSYPYLASEDAAFATGWRLTEDEVLGMFGSLKAYLVHKLNRSEVRAKGYSAPPLSGNIENHLEALKFTEVTEKQFAAHLVSDHKDKVQGLMDAIKMDKAIKGEEARILKAKADARDEALKALRSQAEAKFGWAEDSQSAKDWAESQLKIQERRRF